MNTGEINKQTSNPCDLFQMILPVSLHEEQEVVKALQKLKSKKLKISVAAGRGIVSAVVFDLSP